MLDRSNYFFDFGVFFFWNMSSGFDCAKVIFRFFDNQISLLIELFDLFFLFYLCYFPEFWGAKKCISGNCSSSPSSFEQYLSCNPGLLLALWFCNKLNSLEQIHVYLQFVCMCAHLENFLNLFVYKSIWEKYRQLWIRLLWPLLFLFSIFFDHRCSYFL